MAVPAGALQDRFIKQTEHLGRGLLQEGQATVRLVLFKADDPCPKLPGSSTPLLEAIKLERATDWLQN